ncbi:hypothetical protein DRN74_02355 [Candidatus Micrarchaeota archaeon]|nr:MAG: hypothetical protein DRN74_02355 [Candidatus Micrarchaeota archaeon]
MKGIKTTPVSGPMSSAGIMRFFDVSGGGPKISPTVVFGASLAFVIIVGVLSLLVR